MQKINIELSDFVFPFEKLKNGAKLKTIKFLKFSTAFTVLSLEVKQNWKIPSVGKIIHDKLLSTVEIKRENASENYSKSIGLPRGFLSSTIFCGHTTVKAK